MLSPDDPVVVGMNIFTISHPRSIKCTFLCGEVIHPNYWLKGKWNVRNVI